MNYDLLTGQEESESQLFVCKQRNYRVEFTCVYCWQTSKNFEKIIE